MADKVPDRKATVVVPVDRLSVPLASFERVEEPTPAELMLTPLGMAAADQFKGFGILSHQRILRPGTRCRFVVFLVLPLG